MSEQLSKGKVSKEQRVLRMMKKVLTDVARDTHVKPGFQHPLSKETIVGIRDCLVVITSRENEIAELEGQLPAERPRFVDEPKTSFVVNMDSLSKKNN